MTEENQEKEFFKPYRRTAPWRWPIRILKWIFGLILVFILLILVGIGGVVGYYKSIVNQKPGGLAVTHHPSELLSKVDPFIGTGGVPWVCAYNSPAATTPWGMVRLGPDTASMLLDILKI